VHAQGFESAEGGLDLLAAFYFHGDGNGALGIGDLNHEALADRHGLRGRIEQSVEQVGDAAGNLRFSVLGLPGDLVFFVENGLALPVVEAQRGVYLAAAFDGLLVELVGAAALAVEGGLKVVAHVEEHVDCADGVGAGGQALAVAYRLKAQHSRSSGKDAPVDRIGEGLALGKAEARARWRKLPVSRGCQGKDA